MKRQDETLHRGIVRFVDDKFDYRAFWRQCRRLQMAYTATRFSSIGQSVLGRPIWCIQMGEGPRHIHVNAAVHANEWITTPLLLKFIEEYAANLQGYTGQAPAAQWANVHEWYRKYTLWAVPMVNPDGVELAQNGAENCGAYRSKLIQWNKGSLDFSRWKANIRGVDLNDQFPAFWEEERERRGVNSPAPQDYSGPAPLSEPEASALAELTRKVPFERVLSLHSQGKEIYWNYRGFEPVVAHEIAHRLAAAGHYQAVELGGSDAGYKDWFIQEFRRPGFTIEVGEGVNPLPTADFAAIYKDVSAILAEALSL